jgi:hypothetical protein
MSKGGSGRGTQKGSYRSCRSCGHQWTFAAKSSCHRCGKWLGTCTEAEKRSDFPPLPSQPSVRTQAPAWQGWQHVQWPAAAATPAVDEGSAKVTALAASVEHVKWRLGEDHSAVAILKKELDDAKKEQLAKRPEWCQLRNAAQLLERKEKALAATVAKAEVVDRDIAKLQLEKAALQQAGSDLATEVADLKAERDKGSQDSPVGLVDLIPELSKLSPAGIVAAGLNIERLQADFALLQTFMAGTRAAARAALDHETAAGQAAGAEADEAAPDAAQQPDPARLAADREADVQNYMAFLHKCNPSSGAASSDADGVASGAARRKLAEDFLDERTGDSAKRAKSGL